MRFLLSLLQFLLHILPLVQAGLPGHLSDHEQHQRNELEPRTANNFMFVFKPALTNPLSSTDMTRLETSSAASSVLPKIPCEIIQVLETDENQAKIFVDQLEAGHVPILIKDLPDDILDVFTGVFGILKTLPTQLLSEAEAAVTNATEIFNDIESGAIIQDIEDIPGAVVSEVTSDWGSFTKGFGKGWNAATHFFDCIVDDCPVSTGVLDFCQGNTLALTTTTSGRASSRTTTQPATPSFPGVASSAAIPTSLLPATPKQTPAGLPRPTTSQPRPTTMQPNTYFPPASTYPAPANLTSPGFTGASARKLPNPFISNDIMKGGAMAMLGVFGVMVWL
ncbi:MAG: hypothetical protein L6R40_001979 [Gallowayella cf. fulva]|nr:MAG: hypothetical protein L6R40_001979 [Xanthomendoza cf. fulva]